jgi:hypothetical protein
VTGATNSTDFPTTARVAQPSFVGGTTCGNSSDLFTCPDAFVTKLAPSGSTLAYSTYLGGDSFDFGLGIAVDPADNAYVVGGTDSMNFPTDDRTENFPGGTCATSGPGKAAGIGIVWNRMVLPFSFDCPNAFLTVLNPSGSAQLFSTFLGGTSGDVAFGVALDTAGGAYVAGSTLSDDFPTTTGVAQHSMIGYADAFLAKYSGLAPGVALSPWTLTFPEQLVPTTSASQTVTVTNTGAAPLTITSFAASANFGQSNTCLSPVQAGHFCTIDVTFTPTTTGLLSGTLTITDNSNGAAGSTQTVSLSGIGTATLDSIAVTPATPSIPVGSTLDFTATGTYSNSIMEDLTSTATWTSSAPGVATIAQGFATASDVGTTTIAAASGGLIALTTLTVTPGFALTGSLNTPRLRHTATFLNNGLVLIAGGFNSSSTYLASAELYNPATGTFSTTGSMHTPRQFHTATLLNNGLVLIAGGSNGSVLASAELYNPATGLFTPTGNLTTARVYHTATLLSNGMVLIAGGNTASGASTSAELYNPATGTFTVTGSLNTARYLHTATLLSSGSVLIAGGLASSGYLVSAELFNPATGTNGTFTPTGSLNTARYEHTATLLNDGLVLIAGGFNSTSNYLTSAELFNPTGGTNGSFTATVSLNTARAFPTARLLNNGTVLIAGGNNSSGFLASAELYDPVAVTFTATGSLNTARNLHTATLLDNGMVLMSGGSNSSGAVADGELYVPGTLTPPNLTSISLAPSNPTVPLGTAQHLTATGTFSVGGPEQLASVTWSSSSPAVVVTNDASNPGAAYAAGAGSSATVSACTGSTCGTTTVTVGAAVLASIAVTPTNLLLTTGNTQQFTATGTYSDGSTQNLTGSVTWGSSATGVATIASGGLAMGVAEGTSSISAMMSSITGATTLTVAPVLTSLAVTPPTPSIALGATQQFTATGTFTDLSTLNLTNIVTWSSTAQGVATISNTSGAQGLATTTGLGTTTITAALGATSGTAALTVTQGSVVTDSLNTTRYGHTATVLNDPLVLIAGGVNGGIVASAELYNPVTGTFTATGSLNTARYYHTATPLNNGLVLIAGGYSGSTASASAELYNPATETFTATGSLNTARELHTATLLGNGMVLIAGGYNPSTGSYLASAEVYNPATGTFSYTGSLNTAREDHTATLLNNGNVLITGGYNPHSGGFLASAELYNPATGTFTLTGSLNTARELHTATMLNNSMVLIAGGFGSSGYLASAELYNPAAGTFTATTGNLNTAREYHTASLLNNGLVLVAGGSNTTGYLASTELFNPTTGTFTATGSLNTARRMHTAALLNNGMVLMAGGLNSSGSLGSAELYEPATLTPPNLVSISLSPSNPTVFLHTPLRFTATGTFSVGSPQQLASVTWSSSSTAVASVSNDASNPGASYALATGTATVSACAGAVCGSTTLKSVLPVVNWPGPIVAPPGPPSLPVPEQPTPPPTVPQQPTLPPTVAPTITPSGTGTEPVVRSPGPAVLPPSPPSAPVAEQSPTVPATVSVSGTGTRVAMASLSASGRSFGNQALNTTSAAQTETLTNTGATDFTISIVTLSGTNASDFAKSSDTCTGATLAPNSTCTVSVTFTPSATGSRSASLNFTGDASNNPQAVALSGTGIAPVAR